MHHLLRVLVLSVAVAASSLATVAHAQTVPQLTPNVMLLVDTSGSMERLGSCACPASDPSCTACLPRCDNVSSGTNQQNRWSTVLSALTGTYSPYTCRTDARPSSGTAPDVGYYLPHYSITSATQASDGILDTYATRVKFGLMTYDNVPTLTTQATLVTSPGWTTSFDTSSRTSVGDFSYGTNAVFRIPGCATPFTMNNGARNASATGFGRLLSPGTDATDTVSSANAIQSELLALRPFGATPTGGMFADLEYFYDNDPAVNTGGDLYRTCRKQYVILITDGYPNGDMRGAPYYCEQTGGACPYDAPEVTAARLCAPVNGKCTGFVDGIFVIGFNVTGDAAAIANLNQIAVAGGTDARDFTRLDSNPNNDANQAILADDLTTLRAAIEWALNQASPDAISRAAPAVSSSSSNAELVTTAGTTSVANAAAQSQFNGGYVVPASGPWSGVLERRRTTCDGNPITPTEQPVGATDRFDDLLDARSTANTQDILNTAPNAPRTLFTVVPSVANRTGYLTGTGVATGYTSLGTATTASATGGGARGAGGSNCPGSTAPLPTVSPTNITPAQTGLALVPFTWDGIGRNQALFGSSVTAAEGEALVNWVRGERGGRSKLGDIYHSSPVVVGRPNYNLADESFNAYRRDVASNRPTMLYVGTNDGVFHAFIAEDTSVTIAGVKRTFKAGHELWGFVPPYVFPSLKSASTSHVYTADGTPLVREVFFRRLPGQSPDASIYHTLLILPMGLGGGAYAALDVTDPFNPKFMWQFSTGVEMGTTLGAPAVGQVLINTSAGMQERAIAMLPAGGSSALDPATCGPIAGGDAWNAGKRCTANGRGVAALNQTSSTAAQHNRCWGTQGRHLYFVDAATGLTVSHLGSEVFNAPLNGGISIFSGETGTIATRAFIADADATLWRVDLTSTNPQNWDAVPFADMFDDGTPNLRSAIPVGGQPAYGPPVISTNSDGQLVVMQGTGNTDDFNSTSPNRVVSYTERITYDTSGKPVLGLITNWIRTLGVYSPTATSGNYGEQVTGPLQLFNGVTYLASYRPIANTTNACLRGTSSIWGLDYRTGAGKLTTSSIPPAEITNITLNDQVVMGVVIAQQVSCTAFGAIDDSVYDPYRGTRSSAGVGGTSGGAMQLRALSNGATTSSGSSIGEITQTIAPMPSRTRVSGFAGRAE